MILKGITTILITAICYIIGLSMCEITNEPYLIGIIVGMLCVTVYTIINVILGD